MLLFGENLFGKWTLLFDQTLFDQTLFDQTLFDQTLFDQTLRNQTKFGETSFGEWPFGGTGIVPKFRPTWHGTASTRPPLSKSSDFTFLGICIWFIFIERAQLMPSL
jgi:hypothetical protein